MSESLGFLLVVDDEEMNRDMLSRRLELEGYECLTAEGGAEALELLAAHDFDAVLLDAMMPLMSGYETLKEIRRTRTAMDLPVLMVTAKSQNEDVVNAFELGANDYITKPINFPVALARIKCHVSGRRLSSRLRESETRYSLSAQGANDGLWDWDFTTDRIHYSDRWATIIGVEPGELTDSPREWFERIHADDLPHVRRAVEEHRNGVTPKLECEYRLRHRDESYRWVLTRGMAVCDAAGRATRMAGSQTDITRGKAADPLTGLPNRVMFMDHLTAAVEAARRGGGHSAVLFIDLDRFKIVNDSLGHHAGDELLVTIARRLESCLRSTDVMSRMSDRCTVSRFGGDEFVILLKGMNDPENIGRIADRILAALAQPIALHGHEISVSASIGISSSLAEQTADELVRDADTAMYRAKVDGKSRWKLFDQSLRTQAVERLALEEELKKGIQRGEFVVYYQPIVELPSQRIQGFEALLRWKHPTRGLVSPLDFIPIAEETGFIIELGVWVLRQACRQIRTWQLDYPDCESLFASVNVSTKQFGDPNLVRSVRECLAESGLDPRCLKLEVTESAIADSPREAAATLQSLRELGLHISLDDFGTGYSSLSYLQSFKIDTLKIDRSFISKMAAVESGRIVKTIVDLAHGLGMNVTAEGIECGDQHTQLQTIGCESGQGYLYSAPVDAAAVEELLLQTVREAAGDCDIVAPVHAASSPTAGASLSS